MSTVDRFGATDMPAPLAYFLSHVHTDHTQGLETYQSSSFIYCSHATKALLLRLQKRPNRVNFDQGHVESKEFHFKHLKSLLRPLPLKTPCDIELTPQKRIRVTLYDVPDVASPPWPILTICAGQSLSGGGHVSYRRGPETHSLHRRHPR